MFCMKCGAQLPDNAKFCYRCGYQIPQQAAPAQTAAVPGASAGPAVETPKAQPAPAPVSPPPFQPPYPPVIRQRPKWLVPVIIGASAALLLIVVLVAVLALRGGSGGEPVSGVHPAVFSDEGFQRYESPTACFSLDYPSDFTYSEPNTNNVLFHMGDQCRVVVEYAFLTTKNCFIYSAEDFSDQLFADPELLSSWIGVENAALTDTSEEKVIGRDCYSFGWELEQNGKQYDGCLYLFDTEGEFGCYTFLWMLEKGSSEEELRREQIKQMLESFEITGSYQAEGYTLYTSEAPDELKVVLHDDLVQREPELGYDGEILKNYVKFFATEEGQSAVSLYEDEYSHASANPDDDDFSRLVETALNTYRNDPACSDVQIISQLSRVDVGRYPFVQLGIQFHYSGYGMDRDEICYKVFFPQGGNYWIAELRAEEALLDQTSGLLSDFLVSLCIDDGMPETGEDAYGSLSEVSGGASGGGASSGSGDDKNVMIDAILSEIEGRSEFLPEDGTYTPLASLTDIDKNGVSELLILYKTKDYSVKYSIWSLTGNSFSPLKEDILYQEVGGNSGTLGLALDSNNIPYLVLETHSPQGDRFNNTYTYLPWNYEQTGFNDVEKVVLESTGIYGEEEKGTYSLAGSKVDKAIFDDWRADFTQNWTALDLNKGEGNGGNNMSFQRIRELDMNEMTF